MSNAIRFQSVKIGSGLDAAAARRQFWLSLAAALAVLAVAAMTGLQPTRATSAPSARHGQVSAPEFVAAPAGAAALRQAMAVGAQRNAD